MTRPINVFAFGYATRYNAQRGAARARKTGCTFIERNGKWFVVAPTYRAHGTMKGQVLVMAERACGVTIDQISAFFKIGAIAASSLVYDAKRLLRLSHKKIVSVLTNGRATYFVSEA